MKSRVLITAALCTALICIGTSCAGSLSDRYIFPEEDILSGLDGTYGALMLEPFADKLCVPEDDKDISLDGVDAEAFALFDLSGSEILSQHNIYKRMYPASTTKILTALLALKYADPDDIVTVPDASRISVSGSSMAGLNPGDMISLNDLLYALMVPSGNDAAVAIACHISGSEEAFSELMNDEARALGATGSHFVNPNGLPAEDHYTTVYDMYLIFNEAMRDPRFREIASTYEYSCTINNYPSAQNEVRELSWTSGNAFYSGKFSFVDDMHIVAAKTGHTNAAGFCLVLGSEDSAGHEYISVIFNSYVYEELYASMKTLTAKAS